MTELLKWLQLKLKDNEIKRQNVNLSSYERGQAYQEHLTIKEIINHIIKECL